MISPILPRGEAVPEWFTKGTRSVAKRLPLKLIQTSLALQASLSRGARKGRTG